jgi:general secretion pathway protein G
MFTPRAKELLSMARNTVIGKRFAAGFTPAQPDAVKRDYRKLIRVGTGFTFIEVVMVCSMIAILVAIAVPAYQSQVLATKEAVLKSNLANIRERLDQFKADRGLYPQSLEDLVEKGYLRGIPEDPMISGTEWEEIYEDFDPDQPEEELGIYDVRSLSADVGMNGTLYSEW